MDFTRFFLPALFSDSKLPFCDILNGLSCYGTEILPDFVYLSWEYCGSIKNSSLELDKLKGVDVCTSAENDKLGNNVY